ncbi:hypothetical protein CTI12_AA616840 [Artemisia annua]|uniref:Zinc knuckle CX2CX4HX4C n=1 Tax=Artemisia annua TaxID=35608 RepID=A0A2U1KD31_ARTAN|nr:hypothetical protein CTI12_AA616840 [Artemisia annua]
MCENSFGKATFARVVVEVDAAKGLPGSIEVCYKSLGKSMNLEVEYAWSPPVCSNCKVFGHSFDACTKRDLIEVEVAKLKEINDQNAQKTSCDLKGKEEWNNVPFKKVVKNGNESNQGQGSQYVNRGVNYARNYSGRGRGGYSGRGGYKNFQQGESSKPVNTQSGPMMNKGNNEESGFENVPKKNKVNNKVNEQKKNEGQQDILISNRYSSLIDADDDVNMVEGQCSDTNNDGKNVVSSSDVIKRKINQMEREIMESHRCTGSTANRKAKEMMSDRMKNTGQASSGSWVLRFLGSLLM